MAQSSRAAGSGIDTEIGLVEMSVVLITKQNDPSILNPDFLRYNGIVDKTLRPIQPPISTPLFSQVVFERDIDVRAEPNRFVFEQKGQPLNEGECMVPEVAERFVQAVSHIPYIAIGINAKSLRTLNDKSGYSVADTLLGGSEWMSFRDLRPNVYLKAVYSYETRKITLDVGRVSTTRDDGVVGQRMLFQANIHRDIAAKSQEQRIERASGILGGWKSDISDFNDLVAKFHAMGMPQ